MFLAQDPGSGGRAPHDDFWFMPVGSYSAAGVRVSQSAALAISTFYSCALVLGQTSGVAPVHLHRRLDKRGKERATDHPLYKVIHHQPNRWQTAFQWRQMMQWHLTLRYNAYSEILYDRSGNVAELVPLHPDRVKVERFVDSGGRIDFRYRVKSPDGASERILVRGEMFHLRGLTSDGIEGFSPLEVQADSIGEAIAAQRYGSTRMRNDARAPGIIEFPGHFNTDVDRSAFRTSWQAAQTGANAGKTPVLEKGMTYKELGVKNTDLQYIELRKLKNYDIAAMHRMPPHKVGIMERATFSNIEHQGLEFITDTMLPWFVNMEQEISAQLLQEDEREEYFAETLAEGLLRGDSKSRAEYYSKGILDGWLLRNEARIAENLNPLEGLDKPLEPMNMRGAGEKPADQAAEPPVEPEEDPENDRAQSAAHRIAGAAADRVIRKEAAALQKLMAFGTPKAKFEQQALKFYERHAEYVGDVMGLSTAAAESWCTTQYRLLCGAETIEEVEAFLASRLPARSADLAAMALSAEEPKKPEPMELLAVSIGEMAKAVAARPADQINVHTPVSVSVPEQPAAVVENHITVPERETHVHVKGHPSRTVETIERDSEKEISKITWEFE